MKVTKKIILTLVLSALIVFIIVILLTPVLASDLGDILGSEGRPPTSEEKVAQERELRKWRDKVGEQMSETPGEKCATGIRSDANRIISIELVDITPDMLAEDWVGKPTLEELSYVRGKKELRIYLDNGQVKCSGPWEKMPHRIELVKFKLDKEIKKALIIEE